MWFAVICLGASAVFTFFFLEETMYFRHTLEGVEAIEPISVASDQEKTGPGKSSANSESNVSNSNEAPSLERFPPPRTYIQKLSLFVLNPSRPSNKQLFTMMYRPLIIMVYFPCTLWSGFLYGTKLSWYNVLNATMSAILTAAPYHFSASMVGVAYLAPVVGAGVACLWSGLYADKLALWLAKRNGGIREAEHRLWSLIACAIMAPGGLILWGVGAAHGIHFMGLMFGLGMVTFCVVCGGATALSVSFTCPRFRMFR